MMNFPITPKPNNTNPTTCGNCNSKETFLLHHVRVRGVYRRLCTSCVLRVHPSSFCPYCFTFYDTSPPPPSKRISCSNCTSFTHSHCAAASSSAPPHPPSSPFLCPPCADSNFNFFRFDDGEDDGDKNKSKNRTIDKKKATVLLCAAKIASNSMAKAVNVARTEAERRVREAAVCRKRAREALEHVMLIAKRKDAVEISASAHHLGINNNNKLIDNNSNNLVINNKSNGNNNSNGSNTAEEEKKNVSN